MGITLEEGIRFHGHLGPYLVLGLKAGEAALRKLRLKKYFGFDIRIWGADVRPRSCLIDGLQLSTGATYGKGNIHKHKGKSLKIRVSGRNGRKITILLNKSLVSCLEQLKGHSDSEALARKLHRANPKELFNFSEKD